MIRLSPNALFSSASSALPVLVLSTALLACSSPGGGGGGGFQPDGVTFPDATGDATSPDGTTPPDTAGPDTAPPECTVNGDCQAPTPYCINTQCVECTGDAQCPGGGRCANFACLPAECQPGTAACNGSTLLTCNAQGNGYTTLVCDGACVDGACVGCEAGERMCQGTTVMQCKADGSTYEVAELCQAGQVCAGGQCLTCIPDQRRCSAAGAAETCSAQGQWQFTRDCTAEGLSCMNGSCVSPCTNDPKAKSNSGCDYWAVDLDNHINAQNGPFAVIVSNLYTTRAVVTVTKKDNAGLQAAEVVRREIEPGGLSIFNLDNRNMGAPGVFWTAYRIESTVPIIAYQFNPLENINVFSNDASLLIPANTFGREYIVMSRLQFEGGGPVAGTTIPYRGFVSVVAAAPQTTVTVVPSTRTQAGTNMATMMAGQSYTYSLEPYQVLNIKSDLDKGDLTGTLITADKPIAVFGGHEAALSGQVCCADHLEHQLYPVATWGTTYLAARSFPRQLEQDYWRIIASDNGTTVSFDPPVAQPRTLNRGQYFEIQSASDFVINADKPISVAQILASSGEVVNPPAFSDCTSPGQCHIGYTCEVWDFFTGAGYCMPPSCSLANPASCPSGHTCTVFDGLPTCMAVGDPTLIMIPPTKQYRNEYVFLTPNKYAQDYITVVAPADASVTLDGNLIPAGNFQTMTNGQWKVARMAVTDGVHRIVGNKPVGVVVYGYDRDVSYGYAGGLNLSDE